MRITNNMMRNNAQLHIQKNKVAYNKYFEQFSSQKKIQKPSDDPTIAVRSLKFRTTLVEVQQYRANCRDAEGWMDATEEPMKKANTVLDTMIDYVTQAANGTNTYDDRETIAKQLRQNADFIFQQNANSDFAGRYLFTGYRTDVPLLFSANQSNATYTISENLEVESIRSFSYVYGGAAFDETKTADEYASDAPEYLSSHRIRVSYQDCDDSDVQVTYKDADGNEVSVTATVKKIADDAKFNDHYKPGDGEIYFVPETGELVFGDGIYDSVRAGSDLNVSYSKTNFKENDIRPEHYFECTSVDNETGVTKNFSATREQEINYQINFSQNLTVNTLGCNAFDMDVNRIVDSIYEVIQNLEITEKDLQNVNKRIADCNQDDTATLEKLNELKKQIESKMTLQNTVLTNSYSEAITVFQQAKNTLNVAVADHGARYARMKMTESKLESLEIDTKESKSENEEVDLEEAYVNYTEADLLYQASLQATSKILGSSLLNYI
ncbi:flagellin [Eubacterium xylanophilum]|uniref:flagellin N-terminal helical domain-containing protein n=1 Tax=Eubacterium xylanophilum TaxID=39497 RepID=UPI0004AEEF66|nr:flagellin [Eubacterium xylanophilum]